MSVESQKDAVIDLGVPLAEANVIVIEDEPLMSALLSRYLQQIDAKNHDFDIQFSLFEHGWDLLNANLEKVEVAVVDILLPKITGVDLIRDLRKRYPNMGIVPISGMATEPYRRQLEEILPQGFHLLNKPLRPEAFREAFFKALNYQEQTPFGKVALTEEAGEPLWTAVPTNTSEIKVLTSHRKLLRKRSIGDQ